MKEEQERMLKKNKNRKEEREMDRKLEKLEQEMMDLQKQLREKEQENRISTMKIKQYKRTIKQAKLKPMDLEEKKDPESKKKESQNKARARSKPAVFKSTVGTTNAKKNDQVPKQPTQKEASQEMLNGEPQEIKNPLADVKAPPGEGKGTFETEIHL